MPASSRSSERPTSTGARIIATTVAIGLSLLLAMQVRNWLSPRERSPLQGRVRVGARPVTFGVVTVVTADGATLTARIRPDGSYSLPHVPPGPVRIAISSPEPKTVFQKAAETAGTATPGSGPARQASTARGSTGTGEGPPRGPDGSTAIAMKADAGPPSSQPPPRPEHAGWFRIPGRYANPLRSGLGGSVAAEGSTIDLDLSADADGK